MHFCQILLADLATGSSTSEHIRKPRQNTIPGGLLIVILFNSFATQFNLKLPLQGTASPLSSRNGSTQEVANGSKYAESQATSSCESSAISPHHKRQRCLL